MFPNFTELFNIGNPKHVQKRMRRQAILDDRTTAQHKAEELKREMSRSRRDRRKAAKKLNRGNQWN